MEYRIYGDVSFGNNIPANLPKGSHLVVKFEDVSLADAPSVTLGQTVIDAHEAFSQVQSGKGSEKKLHYSITFEAGELRGPVHSVSAVLNVGWKASGQEWIRRGDYLTDTHHQVDLQMGQTEYRRDIELVLYS